MKPEFMANTNKKIELRKTEMLYANAMPAVPFNILVGLFVVVAFHNTVPANMLYGWFAVLCAIAIARLFHIRKLLDSVHEGHLADNDYLAFIAGAVVTAGVWGFGYLLMLPWMPVTGQFLYLWVLGGLAAGAFTSMAPSKLCYVAFLLTMFTPPLVSLLLESSSLSLLMGSFLVLYGAVLLATHHVAVKFIDRSVFSEVELEKANKRLKTVQEKLKELAYYDSLTGLPNRRANDKYLVEEWRRCKRMEKPLTVMLVDLDHFKKINDQYGHLLGDKCLKHASQLLQFSLLRPQDRVCRYGGEEFLAVLPETDRSGAEVVAQRMLETLRGHQIQLGEDQVTVTASIGHTCAVPDLSLEPYDLVGNADRAVYQSKSDGRDRATWLPTQSG